MYIYIQTGKKNKKEMLMTIAVFISVIGHVVLAGLYGYLLVLYIVYSLGLRTAPYWS